MLKNGGGCMKAINVCVKNKRVQYKNGWKQLNKTAWKKLILDYKSRGIQFIHKDCPKCL